MRPSCVCAPSPGETNPVCADIHAHTLDTTPMAARHKGSGHNSQHCHGHIYPRIRPADQHCGYPRQEPRSRGRRRWPLLHQTRAPCVALSPHFAVELSSPAHGHSTHSVSHAHCHSHSHEHRKLKYGRFRWSGHPPFDFADPAGSMGPGTRLLGPPPVVLCLLNHCVSYC